MQKSFTYHRQQKDWSCGAAVFRMILSAHGHRVSESKCCAILKTNSRVGTGIKAFSIAAHKYDLTWVEGRNATMRDLTKLLKSKWIVIVGYYLYKEKESHYAIIRKITSKDVFLIDPFFGRNHRLVRREFRKSWNLPLVDDRAKAWYFAVKKPTK